MAGEALARRTLLLAGVVAGVGWTTTSAAAAAAAPAARFADDFGTVGDGPLDGRVAPTGHRWQSYGADGDPPLVVLDGAIGPPRDHVPGASGGPGDTNPGAAAGYAQVDLGGRARRIVAEFRWDRSSSSATGLAFGAFDFGSTGSAAGLSGANAHLGLTPGFAEFAVFSMGVLGDYTVLTPRGGSSGRASFERAHRCDGRTVYRAVITVDGDVARVDVDGVADPLIYQDPRIASVAASTPFWEYYSVRDGTNLPRFVRVSAERAP